MGILAQFASCKMTRCFGWPSSWTNLLDFLFQLLIFPCIVVWGTSLFLGDEIDRFYLQRYAALSILALV